MKISKPTVHGSKNLKKGLLKAVLKLADIEIKK